MTETESALIRLIATDRLHIPISSISGKLKRAKPKLVEAVDFPGKTFEGDRAYARIENSNTMKAKGMRAGVEAFSEAHPKYGAILQEMIAEEREVRKSTLYFGMYEGTRLSSNDYMGVMTNLGFTPERAEMLYGELMKVSRNMTRKRDEVERDILINQHF